MLISGRVVCLLFWAGMGWAQWIDYPTPGTPRTKAGKPNLSARAPKTSDGKPDLSGIWQSIPPAGPAGGVDTEGIGPDLTYFVVLPNEIAPMLPEAAATYKNRSERLGAGRPSESCLPHSIPDMMLVSRPFKVVQNPGLTLILYEFATRFRQVFSDGRGHPKQMNPAWFGYSVGKWDGDTFVVDTVGFNDKSWLDDVGQPIRSAYLTLSVYSDIQAPAIARRLSEKSRAADRAKKKGQEITSTPHPRKVPVIDLMEALKRSLNASGKPPKSKVSSSTTTRKRRAA